MRRSQRINAVVVAVPARNEERRIAASVTSILEAATVIDPEIAVIVSIATDGCTDGTDEALAHISQVCPVVRVVRGTWNSAGGARFAAVANGLSSIGAIGPQQTRRTWIATTDADTHVPLDWLASQLRFAKEGFDAVAGVVELNDDEDRTDELIELFARNYTLDALDPLGTHRHVHGANMGMRANAYWAAGGFPQVETSEDRLLWNELVRLKFRVVSPSAVKVATSGRLKGRVVGGFADAMANAWT